MFLLATDVVLESRRAKPDIAVRSWLERQPVEHLFIAAATLGDLHVRIERARASAPELADKVVEWLDGLAGTSAILPMGPRSFARWAHMVQGRSAQGLEAMVAATARANNLTVATREVQFFADLGVRTFNPFEV